MNRADRKSTQPSSSSSKRNNFFTDQFGKKKVTIREKRGGTAKDETENRRRWKEDQQSGKTDYSKDAPPRIDKKNAPGRDFKKSESDNDKSRKDFSKKKPFSPARADKSRPRIRKEADMERTSKPFKKYDGDAHRKPNRNFRKSEDEPPVQHSLRGPKKFVSRIEEEMPLNKYIAHSGVCARREAAELVKQGKVKVNGTLILEPGYKVQPEDVITLGGKKLKPVKNLVYILLNKPKDFVTTTSDPEGRKTVMDLVQAAEVPRLFPVGRLDRNTTGVLLLTNDGDLAQKLAHPKYNVKKIYQVSLNKPVTKEHLAQLHEGVTLEDGVAKADSVSFVGADNEIGIEIHSGRNRIVRRMFEALGYDVEKLDRVMYAGLTKKNVGRGQWRFLNEKEIVFLKHFK